MLTYAKVGWEEKLHQHLAFIEWVSREGQQLTQDWYSEREQAPFP